MSSRPRLRSRRNVVVGVATVIVIAAGGTAWGLSQGSRTSYRTALVGHATVSQTLAATGTVSPVSHADETFQVAGTVAHVYVKTGQKVRAGQLLAHLDRSALRAQLRQAQSTLAAARNRISVDQSGQSDQASRGSSPAFQASEPSQVISSPPSGSGNVGNPGSDNLSRLQSAVRSAQQATDQALNEASAALQAANVACATQTSTTEASPSPSDPDSTGTPDPQPTDSPSSNDCTAAGAALLAEQQEVGRSEQRLADAVATLTKALTSMLDAASNGSKSSTPSSGSKPSQAIPPGGTTVSAADIALDQANIDRAQASVATYKADLAEATLRATIAGRVVAVSVSHGDQVSASSGTAAVTIIGSRQEQTVINLSATEIRRVKIGMPARVVVDGSSEVTTGHVVDINVAGTKSSTGSVSYPVTITLPDGTDAVTGAAASVTVVVATVDNVVAVPTSAVHYSGVTAYVQVLRAGKQTRRAVEVGAVGAALTQITSGLTDGQQVILADLDAAVPSSSSSVNRGFGRLGGGGGGNFVRRFSGGGGGSLPVPPAGASLG